MIPTMCRIVLIMPLNIDIDMAVFTRMMHNTPSDCAGRLDKPILMNKFVIHFMMQCVKLINGNYFDLVDSLQIKDLRICDVGQQEQFVKSLFCYKK